MRALYKGCDMKLADRCAIEHFGIPSAALMDAAASAVAQQINTLYPADTHPRLLILCGKGNNGGDGFCAARFLSKYRVSLVPCYPENSTLSPDAALYAATARKMAIPFLSLYGQSVEELTRQFSDYDLIIDALFGTGFSGTIRDRKIQDIILAANQSNVPILSIDVPSGADATDGTIGESDRPDYYDTVLQAQVTVTLAAIKSGMMLYPAYDKCGRILSADIGMPPAALSAITPALYEIEATDIAPRLPRRFSTSHKTSYGKALCIGGSANMKGAPILSAQAALTSGCGLVKLASLSSVCDAAVLSQPELLTLSVNANADGGLSAEALPRLTEAMKESSALAIGPGMGSSDDVRAIVAAALKSGRPLCIDADGLNALSRDSSLLSERQGAVIITPHEMELARLTGKDIVWIRTHRPQAVRLLTDEYGVITVLKGAHTLIALPDRTLLIPTGNPGMSTAGSGDVLTGMIVSFLAQGSPAEDAAMIGCYLHGVSGDLAAHTRGESSLIAGDIIDALPEVLNGFTDGA